MFFISSQKPKGKSMKTNRLFTKWLTVLTFSIISLPLSTVFAQGTAFTYQGQLQNNGGPASGIYNLAFSLFTISFGGLMLLYTITSMYLVYRKKGKNYSEYLNSASVPLGLLRTQCVAHSNRDSDGSHRVHRPGRHSDTGSCFAASGESPHPSLGSAM